MPIGNEVIAKWAAEGHYAFTPKEFEQEIGGTHSAAKLSLNRLARKGVVAHPARGFWVIVPPEYSRLGCLPADQFVPELMGQLQMPYYAALLSAAQYHGAAHHRPQVFQVMVPQNRRPIECGDVRVAFVARRRIEEVPIQSVNTSRGTIRVSSPESTAVDLVGYERHAGGLDNVSTVLAELSDHLDPGRLVAAAQTAPLPWAQRLGYMLQLVGSEQKLGPLKKYVKKHARNVTLLAPSLPAEDAVRSDDWRLLVNVDVESES